MWPMIQIVFSAATLFCSCGFAAVTQRDTELKEDIRGLLLIINVRKVMNSNERVGSYADIANLWNTFKSMGYKPQIVDDRVKPLTRSNLLLEVRNFAHDPEQAPHSATVVALMSHGDYSDQLFTSDGNRVSLHEVRAALDSSRLLEGKPKLLIVQACRGNKADLYDYDDKECKNYPNCQGHVINPSLRLRPSEPLPVGPEMETLVSAPSWKRSPYGSGFLTIRGSEPGRVSYLSYIGSPLIKILCSVLRKFGRVQDLLTLSSKVTQRMMTYKSRETKTILGNRSTPTPKLFMQRMVSETTSTLYKRFVL